MTDEKQQVCPSCGGDGKLQGDEWCHRCHGSGVMHEHTVYCDPSHVSSIDWTGEGGDICHLPSSMGKAIGDPFDYAMMLRDGTFIRYGELTQDRPGWVHLSNIERVVLRGYALQFTFPRGIDVRVDDIVWHCDAPEGS